MTKKILLAIIVSLFSTIQLWAIPANPSPRTVTQPDGSVLTIRLYGDEFGSYTTNLNGDIVQRCSDGFYRYTQIDQNSHITAGDLIARDSDCNDTDIQQYLRTIDRNKIIDQISVHRNKQRKARSFEARPQGAPLQKIARRTADEPAEVKGIVLLVEFQDVKFSANGTVENIDRLMNEPGNDYMGAIGSARDYFIDQSFGKFKPSFDVVGPITLPNNEAYYGAPSQGAASGDDGSKVYFMTIDACDIAHEQGLCDFSQYDGDGDGVVDLVFMVYAGYAESSGADPNTIWPHAAWVGELNAAKDKLYNGVTIDAYACTSELAGVEGTDLYGIGAICHEYSHTLGLPDWYDTTAKGGFGMNVWSVMDQGCHNANGRIPAGYGAYERAFCGWIDLIELEDPATITMPYLADYGIAYRISSTNPDRYFTLETRIQSRWDKYLPAEGMLIIKVDYDQKEWSNNSVNTILNRQRFQFVPADNKYSRDNFEGDLWPYKNSTTFSETTTPKMKIYLTTIKDKALTNIAFDSNSKLITFDFRDGTPAGSLEAPLALNGITEYDNAFTARWTSVPNAQSYTLYIENLSNNEEAPRIIENLTGTSYKVEQLTAGSYIYKVKAVNSTTESNYSNVVEVTLYAGLNDVKSHHNFAYYDGENIIIKNTTAKEAYIYNMQGILITTVPIIGQRASFKPTAKGLYIVKYGKNNCKIAIQ